MPGADPSLAAFVPPSNLFTADPDMRARVGPMLGGAIARLCLPACAVKRKQVRCPCEGRASPLQSAGHSLQGPAGKAI